jgi:hypothetical protein
MSGGFAAPGRGEGAPRVTSGAPTVFWSPALSLALERLSEGSGSGFGLGRGLSWAAA